MNESRRRRCLAHVARPLERLDDRTFRHLAAGALGGGYLGCELAQMFACAGVQVTIACRSHLLPECEPEVSAALAGYFEAEGIRVLTGAAYRDICEVRTGVVLTVQGARGIEIIQAEVYAAGDVTGRDMFVYMAAYAAKIAARNALDGNDRRYDATAMPAVVFTDPQAASVGLTEAAALAAGVTVRTSLLPLAHVPRALAARDTRGLIKLVADGAAACSERTSWRLKAVRASRRRLSRTLR